MSLWCADFPVVTVPHGDQPKHVTFIYPYYQAPVFLRKQLEGWAEYPPELARHLSVVVVDDGSPTSPAEEVMRSVSLPLETRLFRIVPDIPWNWLAARNIGAKYSCGWLLLTDMDHVVPAETAKALVYGQHDPSLVYGFSRTGVKSHPHSASFFMTNQMFWRIGGYDETYSGLYGTDGLYRKRLYKHADIHILTDRLVLHEGEADASTLLERKGNTEGAAKKAAIRAARGDYATPKVLSFEYHEVRLA